MKTQTPLVIILALFLGACATIQIGQDPVVVNAERSTQLALDTFNVIEKLEIDSYAAFKATDAAAAAKVRIFVNNLRRNQAEWAASARTLTKAYKENRTAENKASLATAIAVLTAATTTANQYILEIQTKGL